MALWNKAEDDQLIDYWKQGLSASIIAERLGGRTRNAIIGRVHRLGMSQQRTAETHRRISRTMTRLRKIERQEREARQPKPRPTFKIEPLPPVPANDIPTVSFENLDDHHCKWPCGESRNIFDPQFCGDRRVTGLPYCAGHAARAYKPAAPPQQRHDYELRVPSTRPSLTQAGLAITEA